MSIELQNGLKNHSYWQKVALCLLVLKSSVIERSLLVLHIPISFFPLGSVFLSFIIRFPTACCLRSCNLIFFCRYCCVVCFIFASPFMLEDSQLIEVVVVLIVARGHLSCHHMFAVFFH